LTRWPRRLSWVVLGVVVVVALVAGTRPDGGPRTEAERAQALAETIKCPTCRSQSVATSDATASEAIRTEIQRRVADGQSDEEIRDYFADRFGEDILLTPSSSGLTGLVWALPVAALVAAVVGLGFAFARWRRWGFVT
jgi:cytochrome c-type biogenesis protein CcmH